MRLKAIGALALGAWDVAATAQLPDAAPERRVARLQAQLGSVESVRAIKRVQYAYGHYVELGLWNDFADLFDDDAVTNYQSGVRGKKAIRQLFFEQVGQGKLGLAEYVREDGVWKISRIHSEPKVTAAYTAAGWKASGVQIPFHYTAESVARLNDQAEVTNLQDTYGYAVDRKLWDQAESLFAEDGTLELGLRGVYVGKPSIRHALDQFGPQGLRDGELNDHAYLQTIVSVAPGGRTEQARGVELIMSSAPGGRNGELSEGVFENTFVKRNGSWKIQSLHLYPRMIVDAAAGWARSAKPAPGPSREFPPDRPPTDSYEIFPKFAVAPFHFDNPVTARPPQYPEGVRSVPRPAPAADAPPSEPPTRNAAGLEAALAEAERRLAAAEAYDAAESLLGAYSYYRDESRAPWPAYLRRRAARSRRMAPSS